MAHGGKRPGAGRKLGSGTYGEETRAVRIPVSRIDDVRHYLLQPKGMMAQAGTEVEILGQAHWPERKMNLPLFAGKVPAGFPSPAQDYAEGQLDLNEFLVEHEAATFYVRVQGHSMIGVGILDGDIIAVDKALEARHGDIVLAVIDGELTVKELYRLNGQVRLLPHNPEFQPIEIRDGQELTIWGVVKGVVRKLR
jgi:DNA polymerase V